MRRARFDFGATVLKDHTLFVEYDGAPTTSTTVAGKESLFGLVEAHTSHRLLGDQLVLRMGKYVVPFAFENIRSSRAYDTVERYMVLNSMFGLPSLDTQFGVMLMGKLLENDAFYWNLSASNGNGKASANYAENNNIKEYVARVGYDVWKKPKEQEQLTVGVAYDRDKEAPQTLSLSDLAGAAYNTVPISGTRNGVVVDAFFMKQALSLRAEGMYVGWSEAPGSPSIQGGFLQAGYFLTGSEAEGGFQPLLRFEYAKLTGPLATPGSDHLLAIEGGWQWFLHSNVRHQLNIIATLPGGAAGTVYGDNNTKLAVLSEMQIKF